MLPFRTLLTMLPVAPTWPALWDSANQARNAGRPEKALELYAETLAASPTSLNACLDAGIYGRDVNLAFQGIDGLYQRHAADFGLPEGLGRGIFDRLSHGRYSWSFVLSALLRASTLVPAPRQKRLLAQTLVHLGQPEQALAILRQIQGSADASLEDDREYGRLLGRSDPAKAVFYYQGLIQQWPGHADLAWHLLAAQIDCHAETEAQTTYAALRDLTASDVPDDCQVHSLALLAWAMYVRPIPGLMQRALADFAPIFERAGKLYPSSTAAQLAAGFGALSAGRLKSAKQALSLATLPPVVDTNDEPGLKTGKSGENGNSGENGKPFELMLVEDDDALPELTKLLEAAKHALLSINAISPAADRAAAGPLPKDAQEHISAIQAGARLRDHDLFGALKQFGDAIAPHIVRQPYMSGDTVLDRRIVYHQGKFYALPQMIGNFTIIGGTVYRIPEQVHIIRPTMPRFFIRIARPVVMYLFRLMSRYGLLRSLGRFSIRIALSGYAVRDVFVDSDFDAVVVKVQESADLLPGLFSVTFGTVDFSTRNVRRHTASLRA